MGEVLPPGAEPVAEAQPEKEIIGLFQYLRREMAEKKIDFAFRASETEDGHIYFYVHPQGKNGATGDFYLNEQGHVFPINQPGPLKAEAPAVEDAPVVLESVPVVVTPEAPKE